MKVHVPIKKTLLQTQHVIQHKFKEIRSIDQFAPLVKSAIVIALGIFLIGCIIILHTLFGQWQIGESGQGRIVKIPPGSSLKIIAASLHEAGVIPHEKRFLITVRLLGASRHLQAGSYRFSGVCSNYSVVRKLFNGRVRQIKVTFPEGITSRTVAQIAEDKLNIPATEVLRLIHHQPLIDSLGIMNHSLEGYLFPETYFFPMEIAAEDLIATMVQRFKRVFHDSLKERCIETGYTLHEILTIASIVEGEAKLDRERPIIASLYYNRLRIGRALQSCPTIQYILPDGPRRLTHDDLNIRSPYNTYLHKGLPPGPVNNPGLPSILAALYPDTTQYLYLVANGDGSHTFSTNLTDHNVAKKSLNRYRRMVRRQAYQY